jgi:hypothetical protein
MSKFRSPGAGTILGVQDEIHLARNYIECSLKACSRLEQEDAKPLSAVLDMESAICDLDRMADVTANYVGGLLDECFTHNIAPAEGQTDTAHFCIYHLNELTSKLREIFYAALEGNASG